MIDFSNKYKKLDFINAKSTISELIATEENISILLANHWKLYIYVWEYGYFYLKKFIEKTSPYNSYAILAALFLSAFDSIRSAFILNINGYSEDSITLLRKVHESVIRLIDCRLNSKSTWNIIMSSDIAKSERKIGLNLSILYKFESMFTHSNALKSMETGYEVIQNKKNFGIYYGPQNNKKYFGYSSATSIFWLYCLIRLLPHIFNTQTQKEWIDTQELSCDLMKDYLNEVNSALINYCKDIDSLILKLNS